MRILDASRVAPGICFLNHLALLPHGVDHVSVPEVLSSQNERDLLGTSTSDGRAGPPPSKGQIDVSAQVSEKKKKQVLRSQEIFFF